LVLETTEVDQLADRWDRVRRHLYQIQVAALRQVECLAQGQNPKLVTFLVDHPHLGGADGAVDARAGLGLDGWNHGSWWGNRKLLLRAWPDCHSCTVAATERAGVAFPPSFRQV